MYSCDNKAIFFVAIRQFPDDASEIIIIQVHLNKLECRGKVHLFQ